MNKINTLEIIFNKCNLEGYNVNIYTIINTYKNVKNKPNNVKDAIYNYIADRMGLSTKKQLTKEQIEILKEYKYFE